MPTLEEIDDDFDDPDDAPLDLSSAPVVPAPPAPGQYRQPAVAAFTNPNQTGLRSHYKTVEPEVCKDWQSLYPIYLDAKRPQKKGFRRVSKEHALMWPLAEHMAAACSRLGFDVVLEVERSHPKDWENPGRVKVLLKNDGVPMNAQFKDKQSLLKTIGTLLLPGQPKAPAPTATNPNPLPPIHLRLPPHSPAISHGILESAMKGGGPMGMLGNMFGGGGAGGGAEEEKEEEEAKKKEVPKVQKMKPVRMKGKRR